MVLDGTWPDVAVFLGPLAGFKDVVANHGATIAIAAGALALILGAVIVVRARKPMQPGPSARVSVAPSTGGQGGDLAAYDVALADGDYQTAAVIARRLHDNRRYAEAIERAGDIERAVPAWHEAGEPHRAAALLTKHGHHAKAGRIYLDVGANREALECFQKADDLEGAAKVAEKLGDVKRAALIRGEALSRRGEHREAARRYVEAGEPGKAGDALRAAGDINGALALYRQAGRANDAAALIAEADPRRAAQLYEDGQNWAEAGRLYKQLGEQEALERVLAKSGRLFEAGRMAFERKAFATALEILDGLDPLQHNYKEGQLIRGTILDRKGELEAAADAYMSFLDGRPPNDKTKPLFLRVVQIKEGCGQTQTALKVIGRLITAGYGSPNVNAIAARLEQVVAKSPPTEAYGSEPATSKAPARTPAKSEPPKPAASLASTLASGGSVQNDDPPAIQSLERRYKFLGRLGQGGNGVVYRAVDRALGRSVVVKFLHQALLPTEVARTYFEREAKTAAGLSHSNIVTIYDVGEEGETLYFSMELVEGRTLADVIVDHGGRLPHKVALPIVQQLCAALEYAHGRSVIHRDIKPGNIMVTEDSRVKLLDFGLAKALDENPDKSVFLCGTPFYMSPEQIRRDFLDHRTDVYSVGCLLYVMYTGDVPFPEGNVFFHQQNTPPPHPSTLAPDLPRGVAEVLLKCVQKDRNDRYQRAQEIAEALAACG